MHPVEKTRIEIRDFPLGKAIPYSAPAIDAQIDRYDARDDFIKEGLHTCLVGVRTSMVQALLAVSQPRRKRLPTPNIFNRLPGVSAREGLRKRRVAR
jgi:hypothetical protein